MALPGLETPKYEELCRLCATKTTMILAVHIFENEGIIRQVGNKIHNCLPVKVSESDHLPKMICENCIYKLELFSDFRERTIRTEKLLIELYKEIVSHIPNEEINNELHQSSCMVSLDNNELIMVEHEQLVDYQNLESVSNISLPSMDHCSNIIVHNQINFSQESMNLKVFSNMDINNHNIDTQNHSNPGLHIQDSSLLTSSDTQESQIEEDLQLIQDHQSFSEHINFPLNMEERALRLMTSVENVVSMVQNISQHKTMPSLKKMDYSNVKFEENHLNDINLNVLRLSNIYQDKDHCDIELPKNEDSNSGGSLHVVNHMDDIYQQKTNFEDISNFKNEEIDRTSQLNSTLKAHLSKQLFNTPNDESLMVISHSEDWYYCELCGKSCHSKSEFDTHYDTHFHKCKTCLAVFTTIESLEAHSCKSAEAENTRLTELNQTEDNCNKTETTEEESENKQITNEGRKKSPSKECQECGKVYKTNYKLLQHMKKHSSEKPYKCSSCDKTFRSKIGLVQHEAKHTGQYEFSCPTCGKGFQCKSYLTVHQRVHSTVKPFPCTTCGQNFKTKQSLLDHTNRHLGVKPFICNVCGRGFITKGVCRAHQKTHTGSDNRKYSCKVCNKMFVSKSYLRTHLRIHTGEKPFVCEVCGKRFLTKVDLKVHSTLHTGEKSYTCEICGKAFARNDALRCHRRSHTGERPYSCDICGQTFTQFTPMAIHKRLHTGERPYICEVCGKTFVSKSTMMSHSKKHSVYAN